MKKFVKWKRNEIMTVHRMIAMKFFVLTKFVLIVVHTKLKS